MANRSGRIGISVRAFAKSLGVSENAVRSRIKSGKRIAEAVYPDGSLSPDEANALWFADIDVTQMRSRSDQGDEAEIFKGAGAATDINRLRADRMAVDLEAARIGLDRLRETTIDRETAKRAVSAYARLQRDTILNFGNRNGPSLAAKWGVDSRQVINDLDAALRELLVELASQPVPYDD